MESLETEPLFAPSYELLASRSGGSADALELLSDAQRYYRVTKPLKQPPPSKVAAVTRVSLNWTFFVLTVIGGLVLANYTSVLDAAQLFGGILVGAGFTPLVLALRGVLIGEAVGRRRQKNIVQLLLSATVVGVGFGVCSTDAKIDSAYAGNLLAPSLVTVGIMFILSRMFFFVEDDDKRIQTLEAQLRKARRSPSFGLALSYFYNFVLPVASNMNEREYEPTTVELTLDPKNPRNGTKMLLNPSVLVVLVPRNLSTDGGPNSDIKAQLADAKKTEQIVEGKVINLTHPNRLTHRPMFAYFAKWAKPPPADAPAAPAADAAGAPAPTAAALECQGFFDIPTVVSSILDRAIDFREKQQQQSKPRPHNWLMQISGFDHIDDDDVKHAEELGQWDIAMELQNFQNELLRLIQSNSETRNRVRIVSVPQPKFDVDKLKTVVLEAAVA